MEPQQTLIYLISQRRTFYEDNAGTIKDITANRIIPTHRHHDIKISSVIHHKQKGSIAVSYSKTDPMLADPNTKLHGGKTLRPNIDRLIGTRFYPPADSVYHNLLFNAPE
eukprot:15366511-Ditylum_brightwellii.AAC.1